MQFQEHTPPVRTFSLRLDLDAMKAMAQILWKSKHPASVRLFGALPKEFTEGVEGDCSTDE